MKICDITQFYSPLSGGVKRYVHEKIDYIQKHSPVDEHVLIVPGERSEVQTGERSRVYSIASPLLSKTSRYRALLNLRAIAEILEREKPDIIESGDPYQVSWKAISQARLLGIPIVAFYHSHFPEAYLRGSEKYLGKHIAAAVMRTARSYVRALYSRFDATFVPSEPLASILREWGVPNLHPVHLGVNTEAFTPWPSDGMETRNSLGVPADKRLLLYVGRLSQDKNTHTLFDAFALLQRRRPNEFHLLVVGDGGQRPALENLTKRSGNVSWIPYCTNSAVLAQYYRAADVFVHPGVQETFGLVALESQACGTPVVGIRGSAMDHIILHDQTAWAAENTVEALAEAIETASNQKVSGLGVYAAQAAAERFGWSVVFEQLFCIYRELSAKYSILDGIR